MTQTANQPKLYDRDFVAWCEDTVTRLKAHDFEGLDFDSLIEEIEGLAGRDRRELESRLIVLLEHLLKRLYIDSSYDYKGWQNTIKDQRRELWLLLKQSPSLRNYFMQTFDEAWQAALKQVRREYPGIEFPDQWPFSSEIEALLDEEFWSVDQDRGQGRNS